jgi:hypothetical protein
MAREPGTWAVTEVVIRYRSKDAHWEVSMDPSKIDLLVFNWERFKQINAIIGQPIAADNHFKPDGASKDGKYTAAENAQRAGTKGPPRKLPNPPGDAGKNDVIEEEDTDPICIHNRDCTWYCTDESHIHE